MQSELLRYIYVYVCIDSFPLADLLSLSSAPPPSFSLLLYPTPHLPAKAGSHYEEESKDTEEHLLLAFRYERTREERDRAFIESILQLQCGLTETAPYASSISLPPTCVDTVAMPS